MGVPRVCSVSAKVSRRPDPYAVIHWVSVLTAAGCFVWLVVTVATFARANFGQLVASVLAVAGCIAVQSWLGERERGQRLDQQYAARQQDGPADPDADGEW